jgi:Recombination endonuclease VII
VGKWVHAISGLNPEKRTAICAACGPVDVLCFRCNAALGMLKDDPLRIRRLADYVQT